MVALPVSFQNYGYIQEKKLQVQHFHFRNFTLMCRQAMIIMDILS